MQFLYDNITATIIATTVTIILISVQMRATQTNAARTARNVVKMEGQNFATWLEKDLEKMGANIDQGKEAPFAAPTSLAGETSVTGSFTFYRDSLVSGGSDTVRIATRYNVKKKGTAEVEGETEDLYQLVRKQKVGGGSWSDEEIKGESTPALGYFKIEMLDEDANVVSNPVTDLDQVHSTRVRFSVVAPFQNQQTILPVTHIGSVLLLRKNSEAPGGVGGVISTPQKKSDCVPNGWKVLERPDGSGFHDAEDCKSFVTGSPSASG